MRTFLQRLRHPRVTPAPALSWLDRADGLDTRRKPLWVDLFGIDPEFTGDATTDEYLEANRYDAEWVDVLAAEARADADATLAAMAAPWPGMARDDLGTYAEPVKPRGRHRQTDPLDLILADLRDIEDRLS